MIKLIIVDSSCSSLGAIRRSLSLHWSSSHSTALKTMPELVKIGRAVFEILNQLQIIDSFFLVSLEKDSKLRNAWKLKQIEKYFNQMKQIEKIF
jgi:16S rRNA C967 or C1407 C5-methylase (RsmB/RsmF family)